MPLRQNAHPGSKRLIQLVLVILLLIVVQQIARIPGEGALWASTLHNTLHVPWFALVTFLIWRLCSMMIAAPGQRFLITGCAALSVALGSETVQMTTQRDAAAGDVLLNLFGAIIGLAWAYRQHKSARRLLVSSGLLALLPLALVVTAYGYQWSIQPELARFSNPLGTLFIQSKTPWHIVDGPADWPSFASQKVARLQLDQRNYPGIKFNEVMSDWSGYDELHVNVFVTGTEDLRFTIGLQRGVHTGTNHIQTFQLGPGAHHLKIPLREFFAGRSPEARTLILYSNQEAADRIVYIGSVRLHRSIELGLS